ncbi:hypothetical protein [Haloferax profundi]|nr:hypothetical protein [Haloferax profundi]
MPTRRSLLAVLGATLSGCSASQSPESPTTDTLTQTPVTIRL